jgi:hypothetical protein
MLTWDKARQKIVTHFINGWAGQLDYFLEGQEEPDLSARKTPFVTFFVEPTHFTQLGLQGKNPPKRAHGQVVFDVFTPSSVGGKVRIDAITRISELFAVVNIGEIVFPDMKVLSVIEGKDWRSQQAVADFYFEITTGA